MEARGIRRALGKHPRLWHYLLLGVAVTIAYAGVNALLIATGREGVWTQDAQPLYANFLIWGCQVIHDAASAASAGEPFAVPQYTYSMGYGADVPQTMGSYLQDPLNLIVAAMPPELIGVSYPLMTLARMMGAAFAFSSYCVARGNSRPAAFAASLAYATCGFIVFLGAFRHPKFIDWAILVPLVAQGADRLFDRKGPALLFAALFLQFTISIYFSYMTCIVLLVYCLIKYFAAPRERSAGDFALLVAKFACCGIVAFLASGVFSLPQIIALLSQGRATGGGVTVPLLFTVKYYAKVVAHFIAAAGTTDGMALCAVTTVGLLVFGLAGKRFAPGERRPWAIGFALCFAGVLVPYLGHIMNGMSYANDRWMLVLAFVCSYILCLSLPKLAELERSDWKRVGIGALAVAGITALYGFAQLFMADGAPGMVWPLVMTAAFLAVLALLKRLQARPDELRTAAAASASIVVCAALAAGFYLSPLGQNWLTTFPQNGKTWENISENTPAAALEQIEHDPLARYSLPRVYNSMKNSPLAHGLMGVDYYTSFYIQCVDDFRQELGISDHHMNFGYVGSDSRLAVEDLAGVKYYVCKSRDFWRVPYGFVDAGIEHEGFHVFENPDPVPLAYLAPAVVSASRYEGLTMVQKQEALLQGAVVDESALSPAIEPVEPELASSEIPYRIVDTDGLSVEDGTIRATKAGASLELEFEGIAESETYLMLENLSYSGYSPIREAELAGRQATLKTRISELFWSEETTYPITAAVGKRSKTIDPATPEHRRYGGKVDWVFNLGYAKKARTKMTVTFQNAGDYSFDALKVACQPVAPVVEDARGLSGTALSDLSLKTNRMSATATLDDDEPRIAVFTFARTPGWSVTVDGQPADVLAVNTAFVGVELQGAGEHAIEWTYSAPGVRPGAAMTALGVAIALAWLAIARLQTRRIRRTRHGRHSRQG